MFDKDFGDGKAKSLDKNRQKQNGTKTSIAPFHFQKLARQKGMTNSEIVMHHIHATDEGKNQKPKGKAFYIGLAFVELGSQKKEIGNTSVHNIIRVPGVTVVFEESPFKEQLIQMIYAIGESDGNCFLAARIYAQKYPNRSHPDVRSLQNLKERFERTGSVSYEKKSRTPTVLNEETQLAISLAVVENPQVSVRVLSNDLNIIKSLISKCLQKNKFNPYHV
ncbi:hypothetical protein NQ315_012559 [Exocentrus adspersus]|uniref:DUF4817 domain-containing protein n=1 Tax=Exocentrus adspersus TaxID=1586481 RepID=A0AAV8VCA0_9CUCU|nr:hypothetical protein NQ315_012559 [Exocentrus adspersus]